MTTRPPLIQRREPQRFVPSGGQGRVGSTGIDVQFGGPGQWRTYDWPLPRAPVYPNHLRTHIQNVNILLIGKDVQFGAAGQFKTYDWPLPRPYVYPNQTRTWLLNAQTQLIGKDTQFGAAGQFKSYDWPLPKVNPQGKTWTYSLNQSTLGPIANPLPFNQADWPLPRTAPYQNSLRTALDWFTFNEQDTFFGGAGQPPANMDWPLPKTAPASGKTWIYTLNQTTLRPSLQAPFSPPDWPLPRTALYPAQNRTWLDQVKLNLIGQDQFFGAQGQGPSYDWPTPRVAVRLQDYTWLNNLSQTTLAPFIAPMPFNLYDWPLPRTPLPLVDLHSSVQNSGFPDQIPEPVIPPDVPIVVPPSQGGYANVRGAQLVWREWETLKKKRKEVERKAPQVARIIEEIAEQNFDLAPALKALSQQLDEENLRQAKIYRELMKLEIERNRFTAQLSEDDDEEAITLLLNG